MSIAALRVGLAVLAASLLDLVPRQPVIYGDGERLCIGRSLLARLFEGMCLMVWGLMVGYVGAAIFVARTWMSAAAGISFLVLLAVVSWLLRRWILRSTLVIDREQDRITQGTRLIARASDVQAVHVGGRHHPAVLVLRDDGSPRLVNSALPHIEGGDSQIVGSTLALYLEVALMRIEMRAPANTGDATSRAA
jgi:hypothetical protein